MVRLKIRGAHLIKTVINKCLNIDKRAEGVERNKKMVPSLSLLAFESSVSVKTLTKKKDG